MKNSGLVRASTLLLCVTAGCLDTESSGEKYRETSGDEQPLYVLTTSIWASRSIPVCWENPGTDAASRGWVQDAVMRTWKPTRGSPSRAGELVRRAAPGSG